MATNPDNAIGTNGAYGGRTSVNALNDVLSVFNGRGVIQGWELLPSAGMTITAGGDGSTRDVAIAEDNIGNKTTINNISEQPVPVEIPAAPASNSRIDLVVAYVDNPPQGASTATDNYGACGIIVVSGTAAATPTAPEDADIRSAITADGGAGTVAYYVVLGSVTVANGTTDIDASMITNGAATGITSRNIDFATLPFGWGTVESNTVSFSGSETKTLTSFSIADIPTGAQFAVIILGTFYKSQGGASENSQLRIGAYYGGSGGTGASGGVSRASYERTPIVSMDKFTKLAGQDTIDIRGYSGKTDVLGIIVRALAIIV